MPNQRSNPIDEIVAFFVTGPSREEIARFRLSDAAQAYVRALLNKNTTGTLTCDEERELDKIVILNDVVSLICVRIQGDLTYSTMALVR